MTGLSLGLDLGTSGIRSAVLDADGALLSTARAAYPANSSSRIDAEDWWRGARTCLEVQIAALAEMGIAPSEIRRIGVDGTSGSMVLTDAALAPVSQGLLYNSAGFEAEAQQIAAVAPDPHITRGANSALARALALRAEERDGRARHLLHQADFVAAKLMGQGGYSDHNNALKTGFDPDLGAWPDWLCNLFDGGAILPEALSAGAPAAPVSPDIARSLGLSPETMVHMGTTDSIAAFLASAPLEIGAAVTSLGTTLAVKMLSERRIDAPEIGLYSHRLGAGWLVGGASNSGGGVLRQFFSQAEIEALSAQIDPTVETDLDYYPLPKPGERFPINDPAFPPRLAPRPHNDADFLHGLFDGIARIEARCYAEIGSRGAPPVAALYTAGGGAKNTTWTAIRTRILQMPIKTADHTEACVGTARLIAAYAEREHR
ncbi:MAG: FGGY-family carbohydrate kinase [Pseudomonadota bacterium]